MREVHRLRHLPQRPEPTEVERELLVLRAARALGREPGAPFLWPLQAWAWYEMVAYGQLFAPIAVGGGKCVAPDTEIYCALRGRVTAETWREGTTTSMHGGRLQPAYARAAPSGVKPCVTVTTGAGHEVTMSTDHPVFTGRGWVHAGDLKPDDLIATARTYAPPFMPVQVDDVQVKLLGFLLADGGLTAQPCWTNKDPQVIEDFLACLHAYGGSVGRTEPSGKATTYYLRDMLPFVRKWRIQGLSKHKRIPGVLYTLPLRQVGLLINRLWSCDGHIPKSLRSLEYTSASQGLVRDLQFLLTRLGVRSSIVHKRSKCQTGVFDSWRLTVSGSANVLRFFATVGNPLNRPDRSEAAVAKALRTKGNTNVDVIPFGHDEFNALADEVFGKTPGRAALRRRLGITQGQRISRAKFADWVAESGYSGRFAWLASSDIRWERLRQVTPVGNRQVYDLCVPSHGNFVGGGVVLHNTWVLGLAPTALADHFAGHPREVCGGPSLGGLGVGQSPQRGTLDRSCTVRPYLRATILTKPSLVDQTEREVDRLRRYYQRIAPPEAIQVIAYSTLSTKGVRAIERHDPDVILADEAHLLANLDSNRSRRLFGYMLERRQHGPAPRQQLGSWPLFVPLSGTMKKRKPSDYMHLADLALGEHCPLPRNSLLDMWDSALGSGTMPSAQDLHTVAGSFVPTQVPPTVARSFLRAPTVDDLREAHALRLRQTPGVVTGSAEATWPDCSLEVRAVKDMPESPIAATALERLKLWELPDGTMLVDAIEHARHSKTLALGFWNHYQPHPDEDPDKVEAWRKARGRWEGLVRWALTQAWVAEKTAGAPEGQGYDSPGLLSERGREGRLHPAMQDAWDTWDALRDDVRWDKRVCWVDAHVIARAVDAWADTLQLGERGVVWYTSKGTETALRAAGVPVFGAGSQPPTPADVTSGRVVACEQRRHGTGWNGQHFAHRSLVLEPSASANKWEQLLGRQHRQGQEADTVTYDVAQWHPSQVRALLGAIRDSEVFEVEFGRLRLTSAADLVGIRRSSAGWLRSETAT